MSSRWTLTPAERFWAKVKKGESCWEWTAATLPGGYGSFYLNGKTTRAHRVSYEWSVGTIPDGLVLDHLCANPLCVNPDHLEVVTHQVNILRGTGPSAQNALVTHCPKGHAYSLHNTYIRPRGGRVCRACGRDYDARNRERRRAAQAARQARKRVAARRDQEAAA